MASNGNNIQRNHGPDWSNSHGSVGHEVGKSPRQPNMQTQSKVLAIVRTNEEEKKKQQHFELPVVNSNLSADAEEFIPGARIQSQSLDHQVNESMSVPAGFSYSSDGYSYNNSHYYDMHRSDPNSMLESFNNMSLQGNPNFYSDVHGDGQSESYGDLVLQRFKQTLRLLVDHPGNIEDYLRPICELIKANGTNPDSIVEPLFEQSLQEANFRYTGARICQHLTIQLKNTPQFTDFHKIFLKRCQKEFARREELLNGQPNDQERLRGLAMFLAEIFLNVQTVLEDGSLQRLHFLPKILIDMLQCLLSKPDDLNVKCVCQLFKLSGALIEDIVKNSPESCMTFEDVFKNLQRLQESPDLSEDAKFRVRNVIVLKEANWNRSMSSPPKKPVHFPTEIKNFQSQEPVFFNHLGQVVSRQEAGLPDEDYDDNIHVLTEEEEADLCKFEAEAERDELAAGFGGEAYSNDTGYDSYNYEDFGDDGGMGPDMEAAFEEYLQQMQDSQQYGHYDHHSHNHMHHQSNQYPTSYYPPQPQMMPPDMLEHNLPHQAYMTQHQGHMQSGMQYYPQHMNLPYQQVGYQQVPQQQLQQQQQQQQQHHPYGGDPSQQR